MVNCKQDAFDGTLVKGSGRKQFNNEPNNLSTERHKEISQRELQTRPSEIRRACENLCRNTLCVRESLQLKNSESRKNPGRIPEKTHKPSRTTPEDYWVCWKNPRRIPEESRKNKHDRRTIPEESRKTPGKTNKTIRNTPCVRKSLQKYAVRARIFATQEFRIPEKSRKNPGKTHTPSRTILEDYRVYWKNPGRIPEKTNKTAE